jgi:hypothetical protein
MSRGSSCRSSSTTSPTPRVWVPRHVAGLVLDYFAYAARLGASARRAAPRAARRRLLRLHCASGYLARCAARCRLLRLCCAIGCLGPSRGSLSTSRRLCRSTSRRSVAPALVVRRSLHLAARVLVARLHWLNCLCRASGRAIFAARLLVGRSHWLSSCAQSLLLTAWLLAARVHRL